MVGNMGVGAALVGLADVGSEVCVSIEITAEGDSVATEEGELVLGNMGVAAALIGPAVVDWEVGVNLTTIAEGSFVGTEDGELAPVAFNRQLHCSNSNCA